jgi:hypothetical protein
VATATLPCIKTPPPAWLLWGIGCTGFGSVVVDGAMKHPLQAQTEQLVKACTIPTQITRVIIIVRFM